MLKRNQKVVIHPLFGRIRLNERFSEVLEIKEFREILELAALGHDAGHLAFSHSLEERGMKTHEQRTIEIFEKNAETINTIFGYDIVSKVVEIYKNNINVKKQGLKFKMEDKLDVLFIFTSLLIGTIDCDRMEYLMSDKFIVSGEKVDFQGIFNYITIVLLNDSPTVGFEKEAVPMIENLLFTRFDQYKEVYYDEDATLLEMVLKHYKKLANWSEERLDSIAEYEILAELRNILLDQEQKGTEKSRLAEIILDGNRNNILFKVFQKEDEYDYFLKKLRSITKREDIIKLARKKAQIYDKSKNKVYIKDDDGVIKDITEVSQKIKDFTIVFNYVMVDLDEYYDIDEREAKNMKRLFEGNPVEIEKKFNFPSIPESMMGKEDIKTVLGKETEKYLKQIPNIEVHSFESWRTVHNEDIYYELIEPKEEGIAIRYRKNEKQYYIKKPADDGTSITKRHEEPFPNCKNFEEFLELAKAYFVKCRIIAPGEEIKLVEGIHIITERLKTVVKSQDSLIEIACDFSYYEYAGKQECGMMLECEKLKGDDLSLWYISKYLKQFGFEETNESKETRAKKALEL